MKRVDFKSRKFRAREFLILVSTIVLHLLIFAIMNVRDNSISKKKDYYNSQIEEDYVERVYDFLTQDDQSKYEQRRSYIDGLGDKLENISLKQFRDLVLENPTPGWYIGRKLTYVEHWYKHIRVEYPNTLTISYDDFLKRLQTWTPDKLKANDLLKNKRDSLSLSFWSTDMGYITTLKILFIIVYPLRLIIYLLIASYRTYSSEDI